jgi:hypothetical protein
MVGILVATLLLVASETEDVVTTSTCSCEKRQLPEPPYLTWAGEPGKNLLLLPVAGEFFLLTLPFIERGNRKSGV